MRSGVSGCYRAELSDLPMQHLLVVTDTSSGGPSVKKGDWRVCSNYREITVLSPKVSSKVLERRFSQTVKPQIQKIQCGFIVLYKWSVKSAIRIESLRPGDISVSCAYVRHKSHRK